MCTAKRKPIVQTSAVLVPKYVELLGVCNCTACMICWAWACCHEGEVHVCVGPKIEITANLFPVSRSQHAEFPEAYVEGGGL